MTRFLKWVIRFIIYLAIISVTYSLLDYSYGGDPIKPWLTILCVMIIFTLGYYGGSYDTKDLIAKREEEKRYES